MPSKIYIAADHYPQRLELINALLESGQSLYDPLRPASIVELVDGIPPQAEKSRVTDWGQIDSPRALRDAVVSGKTGEDLSADQAGLRWADTVLMVWPTSANNLLAFGGAMHDRTLKTILYMPTYEGGDLAWAGIADYLVVDEAELAEAISA